jgi:hypothetical protein
MPSKHNASTSEAMVGKQCTTNYMAWCKGCGYYCSGIKKGGIGRKFMRPSKNAVVEITTRLHPTVQLAVDKLPTITLAGETLCFNGF